MRAAKEYLDVMAYSKKGLIKQLSSSYGSQFTEAEATYGVENCGANWYEQASRAAKEYLDVMAYSRDELIRQLSSSYGSQFTYEEAVYGVEQNGL